MKTPQRHSGGRSKGWRRVLSSVAASFLCGSLAVGGAAQGVTSPAKTPGRRKATHKADPGRPVAQNQSRPSLAGVPPPSTPATQDARPAAVTLRDGTLTIDANNSDLSRILHDVSRETGMLVQGQVKNARVYGHYGPEAPSTVLTELLTGLGYNILMVGTAREGAPRELTLTSRSEGALLPLPQKPPEPEEVEELGPGAIPHPPPEQVDDPSMRVYQHDRKLQKMYDTLEKKKEDQQ